MTNRRRVIESFAPTGGRVLGVITLLIALLVIVDIIVEWRTLDGLTAGAVVVGLSTLVWIAMIRPSVVAYEDVLVIRNLIRSTWIPWRLVTHAEVRPILVVHTEQDSYRSVAVSVTRADRRATLREKEEAARQRDVASGVAPPSAARMREQAAKVPPAMHASHRIEVMAKKYADNAPERTAVVKTWAWPEIAVFGASVLVAVIAYLAAG